MIVPVGGRGGPGIGTGERVLGPGGGTDRTVGNAFALRSNGPFVHGALVGGYGGFRRLLLGRLFPLCLPGFLPHPAPSLTRGAHDVDPPRTVAHPARNGDAFAPVFPGAEAGGTPGRGRHFAAAEAAQTDGVPRFGGAVGGLVRGYDLRRRQ